MNNKIREHIERHKTTYACLVTGIGVATFTTIIMRGRYAAMQSVTDGPSQVTVRPFFLFSDKNNVVSVLERSGRGHPGYMVKCLETGVTFISQGEAARELGISPSAISSQLNGAFDNANGYHFARVIAE